jgi:broad-specificity NMP kinase
MGRFFGSVAPVRIAVIGPPRAGKTTLAEAMSAELGVRVLHTDDLIDKLEWSAASEHVASVWFAEPDPWIIEGVAVVRALRKWLAANAHGKPCDKIIALSKSWVSLTNRQAGMASGCASIWGAVRGPVLARGVLIEDR